MISAFEFPICLSWSSSISYRRVRTSSRSSWKSEGWTLSAEGGRTTVYPQAPQRFLLIHSRTTCGNCPDFIGTLEYIRTGLSRGLVMYACSKKNLTEFPVLRKSSGGGKTTSLIQLNSNQFILLYKKCERVSLISYAGPVIQWANEGDLAVIKNRKPHAHPGSDTQLSHKMWCSEQAISISHNINTY